MSERANASRRSTGDGQEGAAARSLAPQRAPMPQHAPPPLRAPVPLRATYRLQLDPDFGFEQARALVPYLKRLGVSHLYLSPSLQARSGSTHGYDVTDPTRVSEALGGEGALRELSEQGLDVILDVVPNHMGTGEENRWWSDPELRERFFDLYPGPPGGYRRFFDIDDMAAIRQERDEVFETTHAKVLELVRDGVLSGLRVDHPDGLADPAGYLRRLRERGVARVWVEKILHPDEQLRDWAVTGTVGYEFLNDVCALFVDPEAREPFTQLLAEVSGDSRSFAEVAAEAQLQQAHGSFAHDVERLRQLGPFDAETLAAGLAGLPIYRTYVEPWSGRVEDADREAVAAAGMDAALAAALLLEGARGEEGGAGERSAGCGAPGAVTCEPPGSTPLDELVTRFQQLSPAINAKGVEDTAFYRYARLLCLNEVGGDPERFGLSVADFHAANAARADRFPEALLTTQTHDTKRSGDARARIGALSTMGEEWADHVQTWLDLGESLRSADGAPGRAEQYLIHQTLIGVWPVEWERLAAYLVKALRERKLSSSWAQPDERWEREVLRFTSELLASPVFLADFEPFVQRVARAGERAALAQTLLKLTCPGVPDIYQGDELWRLSLVDPDNRRPVDWTRRERLLTELERGAAPTRETAKLQLIHEALALRARRPETFAGSYEPIPAGPDVCAYRRGDDVLCVVELARGGRGGLAAGDATPRGATTARRGELEAPLAGRWRELLSGRTHDLRRTRSVRELAGERGVALLERAAF